MKSITTALIFVFITGFSFGQTTMKPFTVGHPIYISIPDYMNRTMGLNDDACFQFKSEVKDVYGYVIEDNKEELKMAELNFASVKEFYDEFIKSFIEGEEKVKQSPPVSQQKGDINFSHPEFHKREATLMSSRNATRADFEHVIASMKNGFVNPTNYITHRVQFGQVKDEFAGWLNPANGVIKAMVEM